MLSQYESAICANLHKRTTFRAAREKVSFNQLAQCSLNGLARHRRNMVIE
jgi:predicted HicB family RNase H-like nuclease